MGNPDLGAFWSENKERIGKALPGGVSELAGVLAEGAARFELAQEVESAYVHWKNAEGKLLSTFCAIPDPRDLDAVLDVYVRARERDAGLVAIFVHQWTDGEGNWDAFIITPQRAVQHADRICGSDTVRERGPDLREDIYTLFACDREFPAPGRTEWAELLGGPRDAVFAQLDALSGQHGCTQRVDGDTARWSGSDGRVQAMFVVLPDPADIDRVIRVYEQIRETSCPVSFVFVRCDAPRLYDIFRLSARSYLEHHNQAKCVLKPRRTRSHGESAKAKMLENLQWVPRWASHVGCIKGCLNYLGIEVSDAWLYGATGHAFVLNISPGLCPSGPTDWNTRPFLERGRSIGYAVESVDEYCPDREKDLPVAQRQAWDYVRDCIDKDLPCYGWELHIPEYSVIYGYDETGYYISGPQCDEGKGPIPWQNLGASEIGVVLVASVSPAEPVDARKTVRDALSYALELGHNRWKWTDRTGGLAGYDLWIKTLEAGRAGRFGLGYSAAVWAESRKFAVAFLIEARERLDGDLHPLFDRAIAQYETVARNLKAVSETYPFKECEHVPVEADDKVHVTAETLKEAREAEAAGLDVLAQLLARLNE